MTVNEQRLPDGFELRPATPIQLERVPKPRNGQTLGGRLTLVNHGRETVFYRLKVSGYTKGVSGIGTRGQVAPDSEHPVTLLLTPEAADEAQLYLKLSVEGGDYDVGLSVVRPRRAVVKLAPPSSSMSVTLEAAAVAGGDSSARLRDNIDACVRNAVADVFARMATLARNRTAPSSPPEIPDDGHVSDVIIDQVSKYLRRTHHPAVNPTKSSVDGAIQTDFHFHSSS